MNTPVHTDDLRLIACPSLALEHGKIDRYIPAGATVAGHMRSIGWNPDPLFARVFIDGRWIEKAEWEYAIPNAGQALTIRVIPFGGGDENGKSAMRIVAMLAVVVASVFTAGAAAPAMAGVWGLLGSTWGAIAGAAVSIIGSLAITALIPPARPRLEDLSGQGIGSPTLSLTGSSNQFAPYGPVPRVYGEHLLYPTLAAVPITEIVGTDQYLRLLFCCGYGPLVLEDFKIGTTPLKQFKNVQKEVRYGYPDDIPVTLYPKDIYEEGLAVSLTSAAGRQVRRSQLNAQALSVDIAFPAGLVDYDEKGVAGYRTVQVEVVYRKVAVPGEVLPPNFGWIIVGGTAAVAATGYKYGLTYTAVEQGTDGNSIMITFVPRVPSHGGTTPITVSFVTLKTIGVGVRQVIQIIYHPGIATAGQIRDVFNASACSSKATAVVTTDQTMPPHPPGTPTILPLYLKGGVDFVASLEATEKSPQLQRRSLKWSVDPGFEYDVGLRRLTADTADTSIRDAVVWTVLRTIQVAGALYPSGMAMIAMRIKATDQLNGTVNQFNCIAKSILPDWDGTDWIPQPTSNPASIYRDIIQGSANRRPKADSRLDLTTIQDFHERCAAEGFEFNAVIDFRTTVKQLRQDVLAVGRGAFGLRDMKYSVIQDLIQAAPVDVITPRTSYGFKWSKRFLDPIHAFTVRYVDEDKEWKQGERIVYADGYDATNATIFEDVDAGLGVTNKDQVYKLKKRELAEAYLRADDYSVEMDFANLTMTRGDRVQLQHDVILAGLLSARITSVNAVGDVTEIRIDETLTMVDGTLYAARIKLANGTQRVEPLVTIPGEQTVVTFVTPIPSANAPARGDLVLFGLLGSESLDCIVKAIVPSVDYAATVMLLDYAPAIQTADSGEIPPWESHVTVPQNRQLLLTTPILVSIVSDETVLVRQSDGALESRIVIFLTFKSGVGLPAAYIQAQFRPSNSEDTWQQLYAPVSGSAAKISIIPVEDGQMYDIQIRSVASDQSGAPGATSEWLSIDHYTVIGKTAPPSDVQTFVRDGETLTWAYPDPPPDFAGFHIRRHFGSRFSWDDAQPIHEGIITGTLWPLPGDLDVMTYLIKAVDTGGHESAVANYLTVNLGSLLVDNLLFTEDKKAASFPGTHNGVLNGGNLEANTASTFWSSTDTALFWSGTDANNFWVSQYRALEYITSLIPDADKVPCTLLLDLTVVAQFYTMEYRVTGSNRFWSGVDATAFWSGTDSTLAWSGNGLNDGWLPWLGLVQQATRQVYEWRVMTAPGPVKGEITKYLIKVDVPDVVEPFKDVVIAVTTGTRLTLTKSYRAIKNVELNLVNDAGTALTATIEDYGTGGPPLTGGPLIKTRDAARVAVAGKISGRIQGY